MGIGSVGGYAGGYGYGLTGESGKAKQTEGDYASEYSVAEAMSTEKERDSQRTAGDVKNEAADAYARMYHQGADKRENCISGYETEENGGYDWEKALMCREAEESTKENPVFEVTTVVNGEEFTEKIHVNDVMPTKATQQEMYAFFEHCDSVNGTEGSYEKFMAFMDTAKQHGYWEGNDTYEQFASEPHNWREILPKVWGDAASMGMYNVYNEGTALSDPIEKVFISKIEFEPSKAESKPIQTKVDFSWPDIPDELLEVLYAGFYTEENEARFGEGLEGANNLFYLEFGIRSRIAKQIDADVTRGTDKMWDSAISVLESMMDELDEYFEGGLGNLDSVKEEIKGLKDMYRSVIEDLKAAKEAAVKEAEADQSEVDPFRQALVEYMAEIYEKIKNGNTEEEFQIGAMSLTLKEWDELIDRFDDLEEEIKEAVKAEIERQREAERTAETTKTDESADSTVLSSEIRKSLFREATGNKPELSYITCFTPEGILCKRTGMGENEYLWKLDFEDEQDYEKVMSLVNSFPSDWNLKFTPNEKFWKDYLAERIDKDDFVSNLNQYSDKGKMNYLIERDGNTHFDRDAAKYCNYMNNPEDRIYTLKEFTELIANEIKENQKKTVDPGDKNALRIIDEQMEEFKRHMLGANYNKVFHKDYFSNHYIWRANNTDELFEIFSRTGELFTTMKYSDLMKLDEETLVSEYGFNEELLKTLSHVRDEK